MAVPKKRSSKSKTKNRKNHWKKKANKEVLKALKLAILDLNRILL